MILICCRNCEPAVSVCFIKIEAGLIGMIIELSEIFIVPLVIVRIPDSRELNRSNCKFRLDEESQCLRNFLELHKFCLRLRCIVEMRLSL